MSDLSPGGLHRGKHGARVMGNPWNRADLIEALTFEQQADAVLNQAAPVSGTGYAVLGSVAVPELNVRILSGVATVTWTVQPTPLELHFYLDGIHHIHTVANPVSAMNYEAGHSTVVAATLQYLFDATLWDYRPRPPLYDECRSLYITAETTGGTVSNLSARVKWLRRG